MIRTIAKLFLLIVCSIQFTLVHAQQNIKLKRKDRKRDIEMVTTLGTMILRLYDSTPLHRDNFLRLAKSGYFDSLLFHRVIRGFVIQAGDPDSKYAAPGKSLGEGGPSYTIPAEFRTSLFHRKGVLAAARESDAINPSKASSGSQFYIVQGKTFSDVQMDSIEVARLKGRKIPAQYREVYKSMGGTPQLDQNYTIFGEVIMGLDVIDKIAAMPTSKGPDRDRPLQDVRIIKVKLVKRAKIIKKYGTGNWEFGI